MITDSYGRQIPQHAHGTVNLGQFTSSSRRMTHAVLELFDRIVDQKLLVRRINLVAAHVLHESQTGRDNTPRQLDLFTDYAAKQKQAELEQGQLQKERKRQEAILKIRERYGKNALLKGMNLEEGATTRERNQQIGGHKA